MHSRIYGHQHQAMQDCRHTHSERNLLTNLLCTECINASGEPTMCIPHIDDITVDVTGGTYRI